MVRHSPWKMCTTPCACIKPGLFSSAAVVPQSKSTDLCSLAAVVPESKSTDLCSSAAVVPQSKSTALCSWAAVVPKSKSAEKRSSAAPSHHDIYGTRQTNSLAVYFVFG